MTDGGLANWLPLAQSEGRVSGDVWNQFGRHLERALGDLREESFLIVDVRWPSGENGTSGTKYLQYALSDSGTRRILTAEASSLRFQSGLTPSSHTQQSLIDAMGWERPDNQNHSRDFVWPGELDQVVDQSLRILRDIWGVAHPSFVTVQGRRTFDPVDALSEQATAEEVLAKVAAWLTAAGAPEVTSTQGTCTVRVEDQELRVTAEGEAITLVLPLPTTEPLDAESLLGATETVAGVGRVGRHVLPDGRTRVDLTLQLPVIHLTRPQFEAHVGALLTTARRLLPHLGGLPAAKSTGHRR